MTTAYPHRYPGPRWSLHYGSYAGIERVAVNELQRLVQGYLPYVLEIRQDKGRDENLIVIGTEESSPLVAELAAKGTIRVPEQAEGYAITCLPSPWPEKQRLLVVAGRDAKGVLNGVHAFGAQELFAGTDLYRERQPRRVLDELADFSRSEAPAVTGRGIWTWGYVIYDYRRFLDNMAKLRLNLLVVWNDEPPVNFGDVIAYAHDRGIHVIAAFHWGWGVDGVDLSRAEDRARIKADVLRDYRESYRHFELDGIYFQTLTEHDERVLNGRSTAAWAAEWVNDIAGALLEQAPGLRLLFGLHATSIREDYAELAGLDPRVTIMWEDAGVTPYAYLPRLEHDRWDLSHPQRLDDFEETLAYSKRLATFRPGAEFAICPKGFSLLDWRGEFEHHGPFILGERSREFARRRLESRQLSWDNVNPRWFACYQHAARFYRELLECAPAGVTAAALVEDGLLEERIQPSVALYAETLWDPRRHPDDILRHAMSPHYLNA